jgi:hypothetical protein
MRAPPERTPGASLGLRWKRIQVSAEDKRNADAAWRNSEVDLRLMCEGRKIRGAWGKRGWGEGGSLVRRARERDQPGREEGVNAKVQDNYPHGWQCVFHFDQVCVFLRSPIKPLPESTNPTPPPHPAPPSRRFPSLCPYIIARLDG